MLLNGLLRLIIGLGIMQVLMIFYIFLQTRAIRILRKNFNDFLLVQNRVEDVKTVKKNIALV